MASRKIERELESLDELHRAEAAEIRVPALRQALSDKVNLIVAKAAKLSAEFKLQELVPDLCTAFERLLVNPLKTDPKCWGKEAVAKALKHLGHGDSAVYLKGVDHVQLEPVWGGEEDMATTVRATCALAILDCFDLRREDKLWHVQRLLTDNAPSLRKEAAQAIEFLGGPEAALMLRIKARMGDSDLTVTGQVFASLLRVEGDGAVPLLAEFVRSPNPEIREEAALALGASRLSRAVEVLKEQLTRKYVLLDREVAFRALSISRHEEAIRFLLEVVRTERMQEVLAVLDALKLYRESPEVRTKIAEAVAVRGEREIQREFDNLFGRA